MTQPPSLTLTLFAPQRLGMFILLSVLALAAPLVANAQPITSDSRIKTFVYNPNEVYAITTHYGYQGNVEFALKENIETISVGDRVAWQIIPAGRRLFIRAMEENARTNMTVVTNLRAYQFDLRSSSADAVFGSEELTYVVRFFYPAEALAGGAVYVPPVTGITPPPASARAEPLASPAASTAESGSGSVPAPVRSSTRVATVPVTQPDNAPERLASPAPAGRANYRYTFSGPSDIAPTRIYDDGKTTYFKLPAAATDPKFYIVTAYGESIDVPSRRTTDGLLAVDTVAPRFRMNQAGRDVIVYNEAGGEVN